jgi:choline-sulfatase
VAIVGLATAVVLWVGLSGTAPVPAEDPADPAEDPAPETSTKVRKARKQPKPVAHQTSGPPRPLNVLLIVVDTLRADHLGAWGYERNTSPAIDGIAADGIRYTTGISQAPWTTPSMGALMTSLYPSALGILGDRSVLPDDVTLLPEILNDAGYRTGAVISHSFCSSKWNFDQGFDDFNESNVLGHDAITSPGVTEGGLDFLEKQTDEPFFLWLHYFDPHFAYALHETTDFTPDSPYDGRVKSSLKFSKLARIQDSLDDDDLAQLDRLYDSEIAYTDAHIAMVVDKLRALDLYDDTVIVFTADHGEEFMDHGRLGHAKTLYQELVNVPLIVKCPGWEPGVVDVPAGNIDVLPTVLACLNRDVPGDISGSVLPRSSDSEHHPIFSETQRGTRPRSIVSGQYKLIHNTKRNKGYELYDLRADPGEQRDLSKRQPDVFDRLKTELSAWERKVSNRPRQSTDVELDDEERARLEALGYLDHAE